MPIKNNEYLRTVVYIKLPKTSVGDATTFTNHHVIKLAYYK